MKLKGIILLVVAVVFAAVLLILLRGRKLEQPEIAELMTHRNLGLAYLEEGQPQEAEGEFRKLIELAPEEAIGYANLGVAYLRLGKFADAEAQVKNALEKSKDPDIRLILAEIYEKSGKNQEALQELKKILKDHPDHIQANYKASQLYARDSSLKDRWSKVEEHLSKVVESMPANLPARLQLIEALLRNGKAGPAASNLEQILQQVPELPPAATEFYDKALYLTRSSQAEQALAPAITVHNLLKPTPLYQAGIFELSGPGAAFIGSPIVHFSDKVSSQLQARGTGVPTVRFTDVTSSTGLDVIQSDDSRRGFASSLALGDYDGDGDQDLYAGNSLLRNNLGKFLDNSTEAGVFGTERSTDAVFADFNNDAKLDLYVVRDQGGVLYENQGNGKFLDVTASAGLQNTSAGKAALFLDLDQDGDLDLYVVNESENRAYRNNSDGTFTEVAGKMGIADGNAGGRDATFGDFDEDGDIDLFLANQDASNILYSNLRQGQFEDVTSQSGLITAGNSLSVAEGDYNNDGFLDLFVAGSAGTSVLLRNKGDGSFEKDASSIQLNENLRKVDGFDAVFFDFDNDGFLDLLVAGKVETGKNDSGVLLFHNDGTGKFIDVTSLLPEDLKSGGKVAVGDYDMDGDLDLFLTDSTGRIRLLRNDGGNANRWLNVRLIGLGTGSGKNNRDGIGAKVEVKSGDLYQMRVVTDPVLHFGLGSHPRADVVRIVWTNGVPQNHFLPNANQQIVETQVLKGSCLFMYAWNGQKHEFVTDIMWRSALGMPLGIMGGTTAYAFANSTDEYLKLPGEDLKQTDGKYSLRITEELWETAYLDKTRLVVIDHPKSVDIFVDERFVPPPFPAVRIFTVGEKNFPVSALDERGNDLLPLLRMQDDQYVSHLKPAKYQGITEMHDLILNLGKLSLNDKIVLFLNGWIFPSDASINVAISQSDQTKVVAPHLQVPDSNGNWQTVITNLSFPMGKNKVVVADLSGKFLTNDYRVRIRTNMEIYWDQIFFSKNEPDTSLRHTTLEPVSADLHYRGFSRMYRKGAYGPHWFDYGVVTQGPLWRDLEGNYTRYGDVIPLLMESDDQYVIINSGDEISIQFDASRVPQLPPGWSRDYLIYTDGWIKDGDLNTAFSKTVDPLPFHAMTSYPYGKGEFYPTDEQHQQYLRTYNTRNIQATKFRKMPRVP